MCGLTGYFGGNWINGYKGAKHQLAARAKLQNIAALIQMEVSYTLIILAHLLTIVFQLLISP